MYGYSTPGHAEAPRTPPLGYRSTHSAYTSSSDNDYSYSRGSYTYGRDVTTSSCSVWTCGHCRYSANVSSSCTICGSSRSTWSHHQRVSTGPSADAYSNRSSSNGRVAYESTTETPRYTYLDGRGSTFERRSAETLSSSLQETPRHYGQRESREVDTRSAATSHREAGTRSSGRASSVYRMSTAPYRCILCSSQMREPESLLRLVRCRCRVCKPCMQRSMLPTNMRELDASAMCRALKCPVCTDQVLCSDLEKALEHSNCEDIEEKLYHALEEQVVRDRGGAYSSSLASQEPEVRLGFKMCKGLLMVENALRNPSGGMTLAEQGMKEMQRQLRKIDSPSFVEGALVELVACAIVYRGHLSKLLRTWLTRGLSIVDEEVNVTSGDWEVLKLIQELLRFPPLLPSLTQPVKVHYKPPHSPSNARELENYLREDQAVSKDLKLLAKNAKRCLASSSSPRDGYSLPRWDMLDYCRDVVTTDELLSEAVKCEMERRESEEPLKPVNRNQLSVPSTFSNTESKQSWELLNSSPFDNPKPEPSAPQIPMTPSLQTPQPVRARSSPCEFENPMNFGTADSGYSSPMSTIQPQKLHKEDSITQALIDLAIDNSLDDSISYEYLPTASAEALVGDREPLSSHLNRAVKDLRWTFPEFRQYRKIAADGHCFYRAFACSVLEGLLEPSAAVEAYTLHRRIAALLDLLLGDIHLESDGPWVAGGYLLLGMVGACADGRMTIEALEQDLQAESVSDPIMWFLRMVTSYAIRTDEERYAPHYDESEHGDIPLRKYCIQKVQTTVFADNIEIEALSECLGVETEIISIRNGRGVSSRHNDERTPPCNAPLASLLLRDIHYEVLCRT